jgi:stage III sporulation protein SpoIIIAA
MITTAWECDAQLPRALLLQCDNKALGREPFFLARMLAKVSDGKKEHRMRCVTVVIADQHPIVLEGLKNMLGAQHDFKVVACCSDGAGCIQAIRNFLPNIAIIERLNA